MGKSGILDPDIPLYPPDPEGRLPTLRFFPGSVGSNIAEQATVSVNLLLDKYKPLLYALRGLRERIPINQYRQLSRYLDEIEWTGDINTSINGIPFIHFLVRVYYLCTDDAAHLSVLEDVYDVIMRFSAQIPNFDINILDNDGNTPLMRVLGYWRETSDKVKNGNKERILTKLGKLERMLDQLGGIHIRTPEQQERADEEMKNQRILEDQNQQAQQALKRAYMTTGVVGDSSGKLSVRA